LQLPEESERSMKPYYEENGIVIYHGDCREILPHLGPVDLIVTDPPYGIQFQSNFRTLPFDEIHGDESTDVAIEGLSLALSLLKDGRHIYAFGRYDLDAFSLSSKAELVWNKQAFSMGDLSLPWGNQHEIIQFATKQSKAHKDFGKGRLAARIRRGSILSHPRPSASKHPTEKPVQLLRELIESSSCIGESVLDPFCGIGSTLIAATLECRTAIGVEYEEKYCEIAVNRLRQQVLPLEAA
jgi:site-specific DNA-methyltransferase (adenine-specific)